MALVALLFLAPGPLLLQLDLDNAPERYFPANAPAVVFDHGVRQRFPQDQMVVALFEGDDLFSPAFLARLDAAARALEAHPRVERVLSVTTADHIRATEDGFAVELLVDGTDLASRSPEAWRQRALDDRFAPGLLLSRDGGALALAVRPHRLDDSLQRLELEQAVRAAVADHQLDHRLTAVAGHIALDAAQLRSMVTDTATFVPLTTAIGLLLLWWMFRRLPAVVIAAVVIGVVVNAAVGLLAAFGQPYTLVSSILPPLLSALSVAMLMHLYNAVLHAAQRGLTGRERMERALDVVARPTAFTALTTAAGLASLGLSPIPPIAAFGLTAAAGVLLLAALVVWVVPPLLLHWDRDPWPRRRGGMAWMNRLAARAAVISMRRAGWIAAGTVLFLAVALPQIRHVEVETDLYAFCADDHPLTTATRRVEERLSGVMPLEVIFDGPGRDSLTDPDRLREIRRVQAWLDDRPEVDYSLSLPDLVEQMHWAFHDEDPAHRAVPDDPFLIAQYFLVYDGHDLYELVDRDHQRARLLLQLNAHGAAELNGLMADLRRHLEAEPPGDLTWDLAAMGRLFADQERLLIQGQLHSLLAVAALIAALMLILWRSLAAAALTMLPNMAPVAIIFTVMGVLGIWLDMATAMIASVAIGIAVDDTIHFYHGYRERRGRGAGPALAMARTFRQAGRAVTATTLVLCAQFLVLALSDFQPTVSFGVLTAFGLAAAWAFDLFVLPALVVVGHRLSGVRNR